MFHSKWNVQVKRLAYEMCKAVPISDEDTLMHIIPGVKVNYPAATSVTDLHVCTLCHSLSLLARKLLQSVLCCG